MELHIDPSATKSDVFNSARDYLDSLSLEYASVDDARPWGGFFVIDPASTDQFIATFFPDYDVAEIKKFGDMLSPKLLVVGPGEELSWQYHHRRAELWKCVLGPVGYKRSSNDEQGSTVVLQEGEIVQFDPSERHRLIGLDGWGFVAEFWQHTDPSQPSDEDDIVRLADRYGR